MKEKSELLKKFQKKYKHRINKDLSMHTIEYVRKSIDFDFDVYLETKKKNLQRDLCWNQQQKESLIFTILRDQKVNPIVVVQIKDSGNSFTDNYFFKVIDGKQRLNTVFDFMDNKFSVNIEGKEFYFKDLPEDCQKQINGFNFQWDLHYHYDDEPITDDTLIDLFEDCNFLGTPQDKNHLDYLRND
jgi:hypothetical protein